MPAAGLTQMEGDEMRHRILVAGLAMAGLVILPAHAAPPRQVAGQADPSVEPASASAGWQQVSAVVHVHSAASTGEYSLSTLSDVARGAGIDVIVLGENLVLDIRYAPWPFRYFGEINRVLPSIRERGAASFLAEVGEVQSRQPEPLFLPGVEVMPHYYWTGSLARNTKTLHNTQRNMLVVLPPSSESSQSPDAIKRGTEFLQGLPAIGNEGGQQFGWRSFTALLPGLFLLAYGLRRLRRARPQPRVDWRGTVGMVRPGTHRIPMKEVALIALLLAAGIYMLIHNFPYSSPVYSPYDPEVGIAPYLALIEYTQEQGGLAYWSMPEEPDRGEVDAGPFTVRLSTESYPEAFELTEAYTGFGGLYAGNTSLTGTGDQWDRTLLSYCRGERDRVPSIIGESAFHYTGQAGKRISDILTMLWVHELSQKEAFEALSSGRSYAMQRSPTDSLRLQEFTLVARGSDGRVAWPGETLDLADLAEGNGDRPLEFDLVVEIAAESGETMPVHVEIVRQGETHLTWEGTTPFRRSINEVIEPGEECVYYRVRARGPEPLRIVSNPIFARKK